MAADAAPRAVRFGAYTLSERLGEGGMCLVFRARRDGAARECALKLLKEDQRKDPRFLDLFVTEADLSLLLRHPNLVPTLDAGEVGGRYYIAMELIEGGTLRDITHRADELGVPLPPDFALFIASEILGGLGALHAATGSSGRMLGIVHRDVTPHNVFISFDGRVLLGDFGVAQIKSYGDQEGGALGKLGYLSPEAVTGGELDARSDLFAVGIILYELLTGARLFDAGTDQEVLEAIAEARVPRPRKRRALIARGLEAVLLKALARKARDRYQTAAELRDACAPWWSAIIGHHAGLSALMTGLFRGQVCAWRATPTA